MMNRTIKFRGWHPKLKEMFFFDMWIPWEAESKSGDTYYTKNMDIMQFTGLVDENGKDIYSGDILLSKAFSRNLLVVEFINGRFAFKYHDGIEPYYIQMVKICSETNIVNHAEVIGNILEGSELLQGVNNG